MLGCDAVSLSLATAVEATGRATSKVEARVRLGTQSIDRWLARGLVTALVLGLPWSARAQQSPSSRTTRASSASTTTEGAAARAALARQQRALRAAHDTIDADGNIVPEVRAAAAIVYNPRTGDVLWEENSHDQRPIASLTKLMTAMTFIADNPNLSRRVTVTRADVRRASTTYLRAGESLSLSNVLHLTLIASDNAGARVLARTAPGGTAAFVRRMNQMAIEFGLTNTHYADPSGLDPQNVSTAYDISHLIAFATDDPRLGPILRTAQYDIQTSRRRIHIHSTNKLLGTEMDVRAGKTGFIRKAGYCLATLLQEPQGSELAVVVLGAASSAVRFWEARHLFNWAVEQTSGLLSAAPGVDLSGN